MDVTVTEPLQFDWTRLAAGIVANAEKFADTAETVRLAVSSCYTRYPVGIYSNGKQAFLVSEGALHGVDDADGLVADLDAVAGALKLALDLDTDFIDIPAPEMVKLAYSPALRRTGELLNFFPGHYPGGIPNHPGMVSSMLTSGLVGAGLGYGAGWLGEHLLPEQWERGKLRRTLSTLGAAAGVAPGAIIGAANLGSGRPFTDWSAIGTPAGAEPTMMPDSAYSNAAAKMGSAKSAIDLDAFAGQYQPPAANVMDVDIDAMGRTLWEAGSDPRTAGTTMAALQAASQMPGGTRSGFVTPAQLGNLAVNMGVGYLQGALVGAALGTLTGMPDSTQDKLRRSGMYLGVVKSVIPYLFGAPDDGQD